MPTHVNPVHSEASLLGDALGDWFAPAAWRTLGQAARAMRDISPAAVTEALISAGINPQDEKERQRYRNLVRAAVYTSHYDEAGFYQRRFGMSDEEVSRRADELWSTYADQRSWG